MVCCDVCWTFFFFCVFVVYLSCVSLFHYLSSELFLRGPLMFPWFFHVKSCVFSVPCHACFFMCVFLVLFGVSVSSVFFVLFLLTLVSCSPFCFLNFFCTSCSLYLVLFYLMPFCFSPFLISHHVFHLRVDSPFVFLDPVLCSSLSVHLVFWSHCMVAFSESCLPVFSFFLSFLEFGIWDFVTVFNSLRFLLD